jgi:hypothetical protein
VVNQYVAIKSQRSQLPPPGAGQAWSARGATLESARADRDPSMPRTSSSWPWGCCSEVGLADDDGPGGGELSIAFQLQRVGRQLPSGDQDRHRTTRCRYRTPRHGLKIGLTGRLRMCTAGVAWQGSKLVHDEARHRDRAAQLQPILDARGLGPVGRSPSTTPGDLCRLLVDSTPSGDHADPASCGLQGDDGDYAASSAATGTFSRLGEPRWLTAAAVLRCCTDEQRPPSSMEDGLNLVGGQIQCDSSSEATTADYRHVHG